MVSPIGVYADCGRIGDVGIEGDAVVSFTVFAQPNGADATDVQVNAKMRTQAWRRGDSGKLKSETGLPLRLDGALGGEPDGHRAPAGAGVDRCPRGLPELIKRARRLAHERDRLVEELAREWTGALRGQGFSPSDLDELWAGLTEEAVRRLLKKSPRRRERGGVAPRGERGDRAREGARGDGACRGRVRRRARAGVGPAATRRSSAGCLGGRRAERARRPSPRWPRCRTRVARRRCARRWPASASVCSRRRAARRAAPVAEGRGGNRPRGRGRARPRRRLLADPRDQRHGRGAPHQSGPRAPLAPRPASGCRGGRGLLES